MPGANRQLSKGQPQRGWRLLPIHVTQERFLLAFGHCFDVGDEEAVVIQVEEDLAALAEVLDLALAPAHRETARAVVGADVEDEVAHFEFYIVKASDGLQPIAAIKGLADENAGFGRPLVEMTEDADFLFGSV